MKKIGCMIVSLALALSLCGCVSIVTDPEPVVSGNLNGDVFALCENGGEWVDISAAPAFGNCNWEPGLMTARVLQINNAGTLGIKWTVRSAVAGGFNDIADVIDVYVRTGNPLFPTSREEAETWTRLGSLNEVLDFGSGELDTGKSEYLAVALVMRLDADPSYQNGELGMPVDFSVLLTQIDPESDSFGNEYEE